MSWSIVFETKIVRLSDGRILHLSLDGCNNDDAGRSRNEFHGKIYSEGDFIKYAESFKKDRLPYSKSDGFELKIGSKFATYYDYGEHLLRMLKRATTWEQLRKERNCSCTVFDGVRVFEDGLTTDLSASEWNKVAYDFMYGKRKGITRALTHTVYEESEIIREFELHEALHLSFYIGKKYKTA